MHQLDELGLGMLGFGGYLAVVVQARILGGRLLAALRQRPRTAFAADVPAAYVRKTHVTHRPYSRRTEQISGWIGCHHLTIARRLNPATYRPQPRPRPAGQVRWHGHPGDHQPRDVIGGAWKEANA